MRVDKVPKGKSKLFAAGGATPMFGKSDRTKSAYPADTQRPGQTSGQAASGKPVRSGLPRRPLTLPATWADQRAASRAARPLDCHRLATADPLPR
jgi:hypothetical protein